MAKILVTTTLAEQEKVLEALRAFEGEVVALSRIAKITNMTYSKVRYVIMDLEEAKKVDRIKVKEFNKHYIRYMYKVL